MFLILHKVFNMWVSEHLHKFTLWDKDVDILKRMEWVTS